MGIKREIAALEKEIERLQKELELLREIDVEEDGNA